MVHFVLMGMTYFLFVTTSLQKKKGKRIKGWDKMSNSHLFWSKNIQKLQKKRWLVKCFHYECCRKQIAFKETVVLLQKVAERSNIANGLFLIKIPIQISNTDFHLLYYYGFQLYFMISCLP